MKKLILILIILLSNFLIKAQGIICLQRGSTTKFETRLDSAVAHAINGDVIYLPGGVITCTSPLNISKKLTIIGAGYHPDSSKATGITICPAKIVFQAGSDSSFITGLYTNNEIEIFTSNIRVSRCLLSNIVIRANNKTNLFISENIFRLLYGTSLQTCPSMIVSKNIIYSYLSSLDGVSFKNNIFLYNDPSGYFLSGITNSTFENNIFMHVTNNFLNPFEPISNTYFNNLFVASSGTGGSNAWNNYYDELPTNIFTTYTQPDKWDRSLNFHLKASSHGKNLGSDGTDVGLYGTASPFKDGGLPFNPHFQSVTIPEATGANGMLNINITVKAQNQ